MTTTQWRPRSRRHPGAASIGKRQQSCLRVGIERSASRRHPVVAINRKCQFSGSPYRTAGFRKPPWSRTRPPNRMTFRCEQVPRRQQQRETRENLMRKKYHLTDGLADWQSGNEQEERALCGGNATLPADRGTDRQTHEQTERACHGRQATLQTD